MNIGMRTGVAVAALLAPTLLVSVWVSSAETRLEQARAADTADEEVALAHAADAGYCDANLKKVLRRVLQSCGLIGKGGIRGCQPLEAKQLATVSGNDFNALFMPMRERGGIVQFDAGAAELDFTDKQLVEQVFAEQKGASYFFVVARASPDGAVTYNRDLSKRRAEAVLQHLSERFEDPDLEKEVGLLWLGEEFAQLDTEFCDWRRSGQVESCRTQDINRGAFVAWIDCRL